MDRLLFFGIIATISVATAFSEHQGEDFSKPACWGCLTESGARTNKVKLTNITVLEVNKKYFLNGIYKVGLIKVNETYNRQTAEYVQNKNFPRNVKFSVQVLRCNSPYGDYKKIREYDIFMCKDPNNKYVKYISDYLGDLIKAGKCPKKGLAIKSCDQRYFRFYDLLSETESQNGYFKMIVSVKSHKKVLLSIERVLESNCKKL